jgi:hypothetical protein
MAAALITGGLTTGSGHPAGPVVLPRVTLILWQGLPEELMLNQAVQTEVLVRGQQPEDCQHAGIASRSKPGIAGVAEHTEDDETFAVGVPPRVGDRQDA